MLCQKVNVIASFEPLTYIIEKEENQLVNFSFDNAFRVSSFLISPSIAERRAAPRRAHRGAFAASAPGAGRRARGAEYRDAPIRSHPRCRKQEILSGETEQKCRERAQCLHCLGILGRWNEMRRRLVTNRRDRPSLREEGCK